MKIHSLFFLASLLGALGLDAQWLSKTYALNDGWNGIWLAGDASHTTVTELFSAYPAVQEVWRWNPNPDQITFTTSPSELTTQSDEWTIWKRDDPAEQTLSRMVGNSAYLIRAEGPADVAITQLALPPSATWQVSGANFLGFPVAAEGALFTSYFASFPSANSTVLAPTSAVFKYVGGPLGAANPMRISTSSERIRAERAYWFELSAVSDFTAPLEYEVHDDKGLAFGRTLKTMTIGVSNRSTAPSTLTISLEDSLPAPSGQHPVAGGVALTRRIFDSESNAYTESPISGSFTVTVPGSGRVNLEFGIDRSALTNSGAYHASILRIRDSANLTDVRLPVSAQATTTAGLWLARATVTDVVSTAPASPGSSTSRPFVLAFLMHVDEEGAARLLSQAFTGRLTTEGNPRGISISEAGVLAAADSDVAPVRYFAAQMPLEPYFPTALSGASVAVAVGATSTWEIIVPHNDPTNPFVHTYHPDHDNLDASFSLPLESGVESYTVGRTVRFTFTSEPPDDTAVPGWGTTILGGIYEETLTGVNSVPLEVSGTFSMQRVSEIAEIDLRVPADFE